MTTVIDAKVLGDYATKNQEYFIQSYGEGFDTGEAWANNSASLNQLRGLKYAFRPDFSQDSVDLEELIAFVQNILGGLPMSSVFDFIEDHFGMCDGTSLGDFHCIESAHVQGFIAGAEFAS